MTQVHETYHHHDEGVGFGMATGMMLALGALLAAVVIAGIALLVAQPWDDDGNPSTPNVPGIEQPVDGGSNAAPGVPEGGQ